MENVNKSMITIYDDVLVSVLFKQYRLLPVERFVSSLPGVKCSVYENCHELETALQEYESGTLGIGESVDGLLEQWEYCRNNGIL